MKTNLTNVLLISASVMLLANQSTKAMFQEGQDSSREATTVQPVQLEISSALLDANVPTHRVYDQHDVSGTVVISALKVLPSLDLSKNEIGSSDNGGVSGTVPLGEEIGKLKALTTLDLSAKSDYDDASGTVALGQGIGALQALTTLDLSNNRIGFNDEYDDSRIVALGKEIGALKELTSLKLSNNGVVSDDDTDTSGTVALGEGIGALKSQ